MASQLSTSEIIASALLLPMEEREQIVIALQDSLFEDCDHGPEEPADEVDAAWSAEIARRIAEIDEGRAKTIPAETAWKMINGETPIDL
jgi:putative addiction module component (TIGR02574 family)